MEQPRRGRVYALGLDVYVVLLTAALVWPLGSRGGYPVARDLVFTPRIHLRPETVGMGSGSARAAPLDAVLAALTSVLDGALVAKIVVPLALLLAGWGAHRILVGCGLAARLVLAGLAVWNPFVVERLGLGQWALLFGYAATIHLVRIALTRGAGRTVNRAAPWLAVGAVTPTGAVLAGGTAVLMWARRSRQFAALLALVLAVQLPWVLPGLLNAAAATSDPAGIEAFAARAERPGGALWSLVGMGGIWDGFSVPGSRTGWLGHLTSVAVLLVLVLGWRSGKVPIRLWVLGAVSFVLAALSSTPAGQVLLEWAVGVLPGAGLLRDAQKWLIGFVVLVLVCAGWATADLAATVSARAPSLALAVVAAASLTPFLLMPDGAVVVHQVVRPTDYPPDYSEVASRVDGSEGLLVGLPWQLYRAYTWAGPYSAYDPSSRWFDTAVVTTDTLTLGDRTVRGEDQLAERLRAPAEEGDLTALHAAGVRYVLVHNDDLRSPDSTPISTGGAGLPIQEVFAGEHLTLLELGSPEAGPSGVITRWWGRPAVVLATDIAVLFSVALASLGSALKRRSPSATLR